MKKQDRCLDHRSQNIKVLHFLVVSNLVYQFLQILMILLLEQFS
jgi:hypothetical protein